MATSMAFSESDLARFWEKVAEPNETGCRLWTGATYPTGYGAFMLQGQARLAHRIAYTLRHGPVPQGLGVLHRCDVRNCLADDHHFLGTQADNMADMLAKGRKVQKCGTEAGGAKLTEETVRAIRASALGPRPLGRQLGVSHTTIMEVRAGKRWAHVQ